MYILFFWISEFWWIFWEKISKPNKPIQQISTFQLIPKSDLTLQSLTHIADSLKADYIVGYKNIYIGNEKGNLTIKLTTILYSRKENKLLFEKETITDTKNRGDMQTWTCKNQLGSLLVLAAVTSSDNVKETLAKLQHD